MTSAERLLNDFIEAWESGRRPDLDEYLARAPDAEREDLRSALEAWLTLAPAPRYDPRALGELREDPRVARARAALGEVLAAPPLAELRERAGLDVPGLARAVLERAGLGDRAADRERAARYLGDLERGELRRGRIGQRLGAVLEELLGARPGPALAPGVAFRLREPGDGAPSAAAQAIEVFAEALATPAPQEWDEVDRLFLGD